MQRLTIRVEACTEILALLIVMAWADEKLQEPEKESIRAASTVLNLTKDHRARLDAMLESPLPLDQVLVSNLGPKERSFAFVAAAWLAGVDEDVDPKEQEQLAKIQELLGVDHARGDELKAIAKELQRPKDGAWAADLVGLFKAIPVRLEASDADEIEVAFE